MITQEEFEKPIWEETNNRPSYIRKGQAVFNATDRLYNVARHVQFQDNIDCFYDDSQIQPFLNAAYVWYTERLETKYSDKQ